MGWGNWMATTHSLERQAQIAIHRQEIKAMPEPQLRALADHMIVQAHNQSAILQAAMRRIAELELKTALIDAAAAARELRPRQRQLWTVFNWRRRRQH